MSGSSLRFYLIVVFFLNVSVKLVDRSFSKKYMEQGGERIIGNQLFYFGPVK